MFLTVTKYICAHLRRSRSIAYSEEQIDLHLAFEFTIAVLSVIN